MVISQLLVNFIPDHATKHQHFIVSNFRKTFHLFLEYGELPALPILQITFNIFQRKSTNSPYKDYTYGIPDKVLTLYMYPFLTMETYKEHMIVVGNLC